MMIRNQRSTNIQFSKNISPHSLEFDELLNFKPCCKSHCSMAIQNRKKNLNEVFNLLNAQTKMFIDYSLRKCNEIAAEIMNQLQLLIKNQDLMIQGLKSNSCDLEFQEIESINNSEILHPNHDIEKFYEAISEYIIQLKAHKFFKMNSIPKNSQQICAINLPKTISACMFTEDSIILATSDSYIMKLDQSTLVITGLIKAHDRLITCLEIFDSKHFVSGSMDHKIKIWSTDSFKLIEENIPYPKEIVDLKVVGNDIFTLYSDGKIIILNISNCKILNFLNNNTKIVNFIDKSPSLRHLVYIENTKILQIIEIRSSESTQDSIVSEILINYDNQFKHKFEITCLKFVNDEFILIGDIKGNLVKMQTDNYQSMSIQAHKKILKNIDYIEKNNMIVSSSSDCTAKVWEFGTMNLVWEFSNHKAPVIFSNFISETCCLTISEDFSLRKWDFMERTQKSLAFRRSPDIKKILISKDYIILGTFLGDIIVYDSTSRIHLLTYSYHSNSISEIILKGNTICSIANENKIVFYNLLDKTLEFIQSDSSDFVSISISKSQEFFITGSSIGEINLRYFDSKNQRLSIRKFKAKINCIEIAPNDEFFLTATDKFGIHIWDFKGNIIGKIDEIQLEIMCMCLYSRGDFLAVGLREPTIILWDLSQKNKKYAINIHKRSILDIKISENEKFLVSCSSDYSILIWNLSEAKEHRRIFQNICSVTSISVYNNLIGSSSDDGNAYLFDLNDESSSYSLETNISCKLKLESFTVYGFFDGVVLISSNTDYMIKSYHHERAIIELRYMRNYIISLSLNHITIFSLENLAIEYTISDLSELESISEYFGEISQCKYLFVSI